MNRKLFYTIVFFYIALQPCFSQTITLSVDKKCNASVLFNGKKIVTDDDKAKDIDLRNQALSFQLKNASGKQVTINIKGTNPTTTLDIENFESVFAGNGGSVATSKELSLAVNNGTYNLQEPFSIQMGCSDETGNPAIVNFNPEINKPDDSPQTGGNSTLTANAQSLSPAQDYQAGSAVYDALKLADNEKLTPEEFKKIIKLYFPNDSAGNIDKAARAAQTNPFLKDIIKGNYPALRSTGKGDAQSSKDIFSSLSLSSIGGLDVTSVADGLAKFLVKRTKEELSITFFQRLKRTLDSIPDLQTLFPATVNLLSSAGDNVYDYKKYIQNLRESFTEDITVLDDNLPGIIDNHPALFAKYHTLAASLRSGCYFAGELKRQVHPGDILANYPTGFLKNENKNWSGAVQTLQLLSASLRDTSSNDSTYWVSIKYVRQMVNNRKALKIYFGLLYQNAINNYNSIPFDNNITLVQLLNALAVQYNQYDEYFNDYKLYIIRFAEKTEALNKMIKNYTKPENDSAAIELYKKYFDATVDMIDYTTQVGELPFLNNVTFIGDLHTTLSPYLDMTSAVSDLVVDINRRNYSSVINHAVYIYSKVRTQPSQIEAMALQSSSQANTAKSVRLTYKPAVDSFAQSENALNKFVKYGSFMAAVSTAKSSDEVESAIEAFALPAGSSSVKRASSFNVSVNAYAGLFYGIEKIKRFDSGNTKPNVYGVTAPIGIAASWGHRLFFIPTGRHEWSTSVYISLLDLGAVAAFRFKDSAAEKVPTIQLRDIVSPGAFLSIGIPRTPLSFNVGAQAGPNLRKVSSQTNDFSNNMYWRYSVSVCVDIPLFNLYTR